jgi:hypothetical protein
MSSVVSHDTCASKEFVEITLVLVLPCDSCDRGARMSLSRDTALTLSLSIGTSTAELIDQHSPHAA